MFMFTVELEETIKALYAQTYSDPETYPLFRAGYLAAWSQFIQATNTVKPSQNEALRDGYAIPLEDT